jgi:hypothetical protein
VLRFVSRFLGFWLLAAGLVAAVVDGAKSIAASALVLTPVAESWATLTGGAPAAAEPSALRWPLNIAVDWLLTAPTVAIVGVLGVLLLILGAKRRPPQLGREYAA